VGEVPPPPLSTMMRAFPGFDESFADAASQPAIRDTIAVVVIAKFSARVLIRESQNRLLLEYANALSVIPRCAARCGGLRTELLFSGS